MIITNADVADRALELAEEPGGLRIWAALCVSFAAGTTRKVISARNVLEDIPLPDLRGATQSHRALASVASGEAEEHRP